MKNKPLSANGLPTRSTGSHCPVDPLKETCEKFFQIWSHKAANISNELIEYTIRRMQSDRLRLLFQTRNEFTQQEHVVPFCQISTHTEDDLRRIKEHIRRFCLSTRNLYRHLRSDSRLYPQMSIDLDQGIMIKICRFIFKTKILIKILSKQQHLAEQLNKYKNKFDINDPYRNITKAFIVLQSNFEILFGDILDRDFFQNAKTAVQTLPIILDTSKTIRLIFCTLYKLSEPERQAEAEVTRQRRLAFCVNGYGSNKQDLFTRNIPVRSEDNRATKVINEMLKVNKSKLTPTSMATPTKTSSSPQKTFSQDKSTNQPKTKTIESSTKPRTLKSRPNSPNPPRSKTKENRLSPISANKKNDLSKTKPQKRNNKTITATSKTEKKPKGKNKNASTTDSTLSDIILTTSKQFQNNNSNEEVGWTTWLHNATLHLSTILPSNSKPLLTTWASLDRIAKVQICS